MSEKENCRNILKELTGSNHLLFTRRGNSSIDIAFDIAKSKGFSKVIIPEDGSWLHYPICARKKKLQIINLKTDNGVFDYDVLESTLDENSIFVYHSHSGYFVKQDTKKIFEIARRKKAFVISDCSGALGMSLIYKKFENLHSSNFCDLLVSSLRKDKPVQADGGFIASNDSSLASNFKYDLEFDMNYKFLQERLNLLETRLRFLFSKTKKYSNMLREKKFNVLNDDFSLIIIVLFDDENIKEKIIDFCDSNMLEYTICPREIRVKRDAISIEIKRLSELNN